MPRLDSEAVEDVALLITFDLRDRAHHEVIGRNDIPPLLDLQPRDGIGHVGHASTRAAGVPEELDGAIATPALMTFPEPSPSPARRTSRRYRLGVNRGPDTDDWFGDLDPEERRMPDVQADENDAPRVDDWLNEAGDGQPQRPWAETIDRRMVTVGVSVVVVLIAVLAAAGVFSGSGSNAPTVTSPPISTSQTSTAGTTTGAARPLPAPATTLKPGDTGPQVAVLQRALANLGFSGGKADGQYGPATKSAVARFQRSTALVTDGILGPATLRALKNALRGP